MASRPPWTYLGARQNSKLTQRGTREPENSGSGLSGNPGLASWVPLHLLPQRNLKGKAKQIGCRLQMAESIVFSRIKGRGREREGEGYVCIIQNIYCAHTVVSKENFLSRVALLFAQPQGSEVLL